MHSTFACFLVDMATLGGCERKLETHGSSNPARTPPLLEQTLAEDSLHWTEEDHLQTSTPQKEGSSQMTVLAGTTLSTTGDSSATQLPCMPFTDKYLLMMIRLG
jgi:hypothetical protein